MIIELYTKWLLGRLNKQDSTSADDCRLLAWPSCFGDEPYLVSIGRHVTITSRVGFVAMAEPGCSGICLSTAT